MNDSAGTTWTEVLAANPDHSRRYIERFDAMEREGRDLHGEARLVDAMVPRGARILDAGAGPGRLGGRLARLGHIVVGVDIDPVLVEEARRSHPDATWLLDNLETMEIDGGLAGGGFDVIVSAGNVVAFIRRDGRRAAVSRMAHYLAPDGRLVVGFGSGRGYGFDEFLADCDAAGLVADQLASTWDLRPFRDGSDFLVAILSRRDAGVVG